MAIGTIISTLSKLLGGPQFPVPGESKFQYEDTRYRGTLTASGLFVAETTSAFLEQTGHFGDVYFLPNPLNLKSAKPPFLIGTPASFITTWGGIFTTEVSSLKGVNALTGTNTLTGTNFLNGTTNLTGAVQVNGKNLEVELALGKSLPTPSDEQLKENISTIENSIDKVSALRGVDFNFKKDGKKQIGVIAQEVEKILPELVEISNDGTKSVSYGNIVEYWLKQLKVSMKIIKILEKELRL